MVEALGGFEASVRKFLIVCCMDYSPWNGQFSDLVSAPEEQGKFVQVVRDLGFKASEIITLINPDEIEMVTALKDMRQLCKTTSEKGQTSLCGTIFIGHAVTGGDGQPKLALGGEGEYLDMHHKIKEGIASIDNTYCVNIYDVAQTAPSDGT